MSGARRTMRGRLARTAGVTAVVGLGAWALWTGAVPGPPPAHTPARPTARSAPATSDPAIRPGSRPPVRGTRYAGVVAPLRTSDLVAPAAGRVRSVLPRVGDAVEAGEVVARIAAPELETLLAIERSTLAATEAAERQAELRLVRARRERSRRESLAELLPRSAIEEAAVEVELAQEALRASGARSEAVRTRVEHLAGRLAETAIRAPFTGSVSRSFTEPGSPVAPGSPVLRLIGPGRVVRFALPPEANGAEIAPGRHLHLEIGEGGPLLCGVVVRVAPEVDPTSRTRLAEAEAVDGALRGLVPGTLARVAATGDTPCGDAGQVGSLLDPQADRDPDLQVNL